jgi:hypothetical protein
MVGAATCCISWQSNQERAHHSDRGSVPDKHETAPPKKQSKSSLLEKILGTPFLGAMTLPLATLKTGAKSRSDAHTPAKYKSLVLQSS